MKMRTGEELKAETNEKAAAFKAEAKELCKSINEKKNSYNQQIGLINGIRHDDIGPLVKNLYVFLSEFGVVEATTPFDYCIEAPQDSTMVPDAIKELADKRNGDIEQTIGKYESKKNGFGGYLIKGAQATALFPLGGVLAPLGGAAFALGENIFNNQQKKKSMVDIENGLLEIDMRIKKEIFDLQQTEKSCGEACQIAEIYRVCVFSVIESIRDTILPELQAVKAFLLAESLKNLIIAEEEPLEIKPEKIAMLSNTIYHRHYLFVQNVFLYYLLIVKFFRTPILTEFLQDNQIDDGEKALFERQVSAIEKQCSNVKENVVFERGML